MHAQAAAYALTPLAPLANAAPAARGVLAAQVELTSGYVLEGSVLSIGRRSMVIAPGLLGEGDHAWIAVTLPDGTTVRPLVEATAPRADSVAVRLVHVFPDHQRRLDAYHAERAGQRGY